MYGMTPMNFISLKVQDELRKLAGEFDDIPTEEEDERLEKFQKVEIAEHWLYEIEKRVKRTIDAAENVMELDENDIKAIILSHANRIMGISVDAQRSNDLDDLILVNLIR